jgi:NAD(P)-dependent dehydrogenase (short-subunit alcohol dehydrogenase family)
LITGADKGLGHETARRRIAAGHTEEVCTVTAAGNVHMIRVNTQLGYRTDSTLAYVKADLDAVEALQDPSRGVPRRER